MRERLREIALRVAEQLEDPVSSEERPAEGEAAGAAGADAQEVRYRALARERGYEYREASELLELLDPHVSRRFRREFREKHRVLPLALRGVALLVASDDPPCRACEKLRKEFQVEEIEYVVVTPLAFDRLQWAADLTAHDAVHVRDDLLSHDVTRQSESVTAFETILVEAAGQRASDIHLENQVDDTRVRIRVDGQLRTLARYALDKYQLEQIVRAAKVKGRVDIAEHRRAQGGQFETVIAGQKYFVRLQTQPTVNGENLVLRLLPQSAELQSIERLGFSRAVQERYRRLLSNPGGLVLVVGPTGSGKTTTLYAGLRELAGDDTRKVISIEDPVEYACEGIQQVEVSREVGFGFANAMRSFVRQDPDVILLGEVRDVETAREAIRASQTGHLVLSTLHCNDAVDAVQRLFDLEMSPNSVASELLAIFAQRLAPRICEACREEVAPDPAVAAEVFPGGVPAGLRAQRGRGCEACEGSGILGRIAVVEFLPLRTRLRAAIAEGASLEALRSLAREAGLLSLRDRALELVDQGVIAFESLPRFIPLDRLRPPEAAEGE